jgi:hypothetical protein
LQKYLNAENSYVVKSDLQGFDAAVLSRIPRRIWGKCKGGVVEVWALPEVESSDVFTLEDLWKDLFIFSWRSDFAKLLKFSDVSDFWLSGNRGDGNLFMISSLFNLKK